MGVDYSGWAATNAGHSRIDYRGRGVRAAGGSVMSTTEREQVRKARTASDERAAILRAVMVGVVVQALEVVLVSLVVLKLLGLL
jgi:hypothetical protein